MKQLTFNINIYDKNFIYKSIPKVLCEIIIDKINQPQNAYMLNYIDRNYHISSVMLVNAIKESIYLQKHYDTITLTFDNNLFIKPEIKLITLLMLIDCGNRSIRGTNLITESIDYIIDNLPYLRRLYILQRGSGKIWE